MRLAFVSLLALAAAGCTVGPDYVPPSIDAPDHWSDAKPGMLDAGAKAAASLETWWQGFHDPVLDRLVDRAIAGNLDLQIAAQRIQQARAERDVAASDFYPSVGAAASAERQRASTTTASLSSKAPIRLGGVSNLFQAGFDSSWEIDIFGGTRRAVEAADASIDATIEDQRSVLVSLLGDLGSNYATLRSAQARLGIARANLKAEQDLADLTRQKFKDGLATELDAAQAEAQVATLGAVIPQLENQVAASSHAIALLLGEAPASLEAELAVPAAAPPAPPVLPVLIPSDVVRNRPDIRAAERTIAGANAEIGVAVAQMFPKFSISTNIGPASSKIGKLLTDGSLGWGIGPSISVPIFEGGRLEANVRSAKAVAEQDRLAYRKTVLGAFREVEDALSGYETERRRHVSLTAAVGANRVALERATSLYRSGLGNFLSVLDSERALYAAEDSLAVSDVTLTLDTVALYKALGAGWQAGGHSEVAAKE